MGLEAHALLKQRERLRRRVAEPQARLLPAEQEGRAAVMPGIRRCGDAEGGECGG